MSSVSDDRIPTKLMKKSLRNLKTFGLACDVSLFCPKIIEHVFVILTCFVEESGIMVTYWCNLCLVLLFSILARHGKSSVFQTVLVVYQ